MEVVCVVGGVDPTGAAGLAADLRTLAAMGVHGAPVVTALTDQTPEGVRGVDAVTPEWALRQLRAAFAPQTPAAVKIGLVPGPKVALALAEGLRECPEVPVVLDPVLEATAGGVPLAEPGTREALVEALVPRVTLLTPNLPEAAALLGRGAPLPEADLEAAVAALLELGPRAVLLKGGHRSGDADDLLLIPPGSPRTLAGERIATSHTRGTGCVLASAIAALLARGRDLETAAEEAKEFVAAAITQGVAIGNRGPVHALHEFYGREGLP